MFHVHLLIFVLESISFLTKNDLPSILDHLKSVTKWRSLGMFFVQDQKVSHIQQNFPVDSLESVILYWLESGPKENHTWKYLVTALKKIGEDSVANHILRQHTSTTNECSGNNMVTNSLAFKVIIQLTLPFLQSKKIKFLKLDLLIRYVLT